MKSHEIFESNPSLKEVHVTSDGTPFYNDNDAKMHAKTLKDKSVELVVNPLLIDVITEDIDSDDDFETNDQLKTGDAIPGEMTGLDAKPDGSVNPVTEASTGGAPLGELTTLSADETKELINAGGEAINVVEAPAVEAPKVETPAVEAPKAETPKTTTKNNK